jgi:ABC-type thiamin/hydroxymethylpyrimidine transport system permease subunit
VCDIKNTRLIKLKVSAIGKLAKTGSKSDASTVMSKFVKYLGCSSHYEFTKLKLYSYYVFITSNLVDVCIHSGVN